MTSSIVYLVQREEMPLEGPGFSIFPEKVFKTREKADLFCKKQDSTGKGFVYNCPCGCGESHFRSWSFVPIVMEED